MALYPDSAHMYASYAARLALPADLEPSHRMRVSDGLPLPQNHELHMLGTITKDQIVKTVADLPEDATVDDAIERLLLLSKIEQGLDQARRGENIPHAEVKRRIEAQIASWRS